MTMTRDVSTFDGRIISAIFWGSIAIGALLLFYEIEVNQKPWIEKLSITVGSLAILYGINSQLRKRSGVVDAGFESARLAPVEEFPMPASFEQFKVPYQGKRVRLTSLDGEVAEVDVSSITLPNKFDTTPESWGIVFTLLSTNRLGIKKIGDTYWGQLDLIEKFEVMEEGIA